MTKEERAAQAAERVPTGAKPKLKTKEERVATVSADTVMETPDAPPPSPQSSTSFFCGAYRRCLLRSSVFKDWRVIIGNLSLAIITTFV
jgi:hypothetical protein